MATGYGPLLVENQLVMNWSKQHNFPLSANMHGGALVANYIVVHLALLLPSWQQGGRAAGQRRSGAAGCGAAEAPSRRQQRAKPGSAAVS